MGLPLKKTKEFTLTEDEVIRLQQLVITQGERPNGDKCIIMPVEIRGERIWGVFCLHNGFHICLCEDDQGANIPLTVDLKQTIIIKLLEQAKELKLSQRDKDELNYYKYYIETVIDQCSTP